MKQKLISTIKKMKYGCVALFSMLFFSSLTMKGQDDNRLFHHVNTKGYIINCMCRDVNGIVWLGTSSGLLSLPQLESRKPSTYHRPFTGIDASIGNISSDPDGRLWMKTLESDMMLYDPRKNEFVEDVATVLSKHGIQVSKDFTAKATNDGTVWVWKANRLYVLDKKTNHKKVHILPTDDYYKNVCFTESLAIVISNDALHFISRKGQSTLRRVPLPQKDHFYHLQADEHNNVWLMQHDYIMKYDYTAQQWQAPLHMPSIVSGIAMDSKSRLWVGTASNGIYIYDDKGNMIDHLQHSEWDSNSLQSNRIANLHYEADDDTMWIVYSKGGMTICTNDQADYALNNIVDRVNHETRTDVLNIIVSDDGGQIWMGLEERGVFCRQSPNASWENITNSESVTSMLIGRDSTLWIGSYLHGLTQYRAGGKKSCYFEGESPYSIVENSKGQLFTALLGRGVWWLDPSSGEQMDTHIVAPFVLDLKLYQDKLYAATTEGLFMTEGGTVWEKLCDGRFRSLCIGHDGWIWALGNEGYEGLTLLDNHGQRKEIPATIAHAPLKSIVADVEGNVWVTTPSELLMLRYDSDKLESFSFNVNPEGMQTYYNYHAAFIDAKGILWLGTSKGYQQIDTRKLIGLTKEITAVKRLVVASLSVNDNAISPGLSLDGRVLINQDLVYTRELFLQHNENSLVIECSEPYGNGFSADAYYYKLDGFSDRWYPMEGRSIVLSNLPPGDYELLTRTQVSRQSLLLTIHIASPLWQTWWAISLYIMIILAVAYILYRYNRRTKATGKP